MRFNLKKAILFISFTMLAEGSAYPQDPVDSLQALVGRSARRLAIAEQIALAKWDNGMPVEDATREDQVIVSAIKVGQSRSLDPTSVSNFFRAQIEANKLVQYSLLAEWRRVGRAPDHTPVDLASMIRPELDEVDKELIAELAESAAIRATASCQSDVAKAVGKYVSAHKNSLGPVKAIALDRALAGACVGPLR